MEFSVCEEAPNLGPGAAKRLKLSAFDENQCEQAPVNTYRQQVWRCYTRVVWQSYSQKNLQKASFQAKEEDPIRMLLTW